MKFQHGINHKLWPNISLEGNLVRLLISTLLVFLIMGALNPDRFFTSRNFMSMSFQFPELGLFSLAIMISLITGGIDLSIISIANLSAILGAFILTSFSPETASTSVEFAYIALACLTILFTSTFCGLFNGFLISFIGISPILATLGTMQLYMGISFVLTKGHAVAGYPSSFTYLGNGIIYFFPIPLFIFLLILVAFHFLLNRMKLGIHLYMFGTNPTAAYYAGINVRALLIKTYLITGVLSGIAGMIMISRTNSAKADYGSSYLLQAVLVAILAGVNPRGGFGSVWGLLLAMLALQFLSSGLNMLMFHEFFGQFVNNFTKELTWGALLLLVMVVNYYFQKRCRDGSRIL